MGNSVNLSRIIFKLSGRFDFASGKDSFPDVPDLLVQGKRLSEHFPGSKISALFWSIHPKKIASLIKKAIQSDLQYRPPDFLGYYAIDHQDYDGKALMESLLNHPQVELAYFEMASIHPPFEATSKIQQVLLQQYLQPAPRGIDAQYAWGIKGGDGKGPVKFIDTEQGWIFDHEAYQVKQLSSTGLNAEVFRDHGAAVLGVLLMHTHEDAPRGIVPAAKGFVISQWRPDRSFNTADAIMDAITHLNFGDILLLEAQTTDQSGSEKHWPIEVHDANFEVIRLATALGITVIEAGGNGGKRAHNGNNLGDFDDYAGSRVLQPNDNSFRDSGAVLVAAASVSVPHEKISFSNYGDRIDCYAQGELVFTAGSLPASSKRSTDAYTWGFGGTSAAAAIIAGAAIAIQSIAEVNYHFRLSPQQLRNLFRNDSLTTPSAKGRLVDKIGGMPDLKKIIGYLGQFSDQLSAEFLLHRPSKK